MWDIFRYCTQIHTNTHTYELLCALIPPSNVGNFYFDVEKCFNKIQRT